MPEHPFAAEEQVSRAGTSNEAPLLHLFTVLVCGFGCEDDPQCSFLCRMKQSDARRDLPVSRQAAAEGRRLSPAG